MMNAYACVRRVVGGAMAACLFAGIGVADAQSEPITLRLTVQPRSLVTTMVNIAATEGFFAEAGINAELVTVANGPAAVTALAAGSVEAATNSPEVFMALASKGQSVKMIAGGTKQISVLVARPGLEFSKEFPASMNALKGKKIGVTALSSATQFLTIRMLAEAGLQPSDVEFVAVGASPSQALANGVIDAGMVTSGQFIISRSMGSEIIVDLRSAEDCPQQLGICGIGQIGMWALGDWIDVNPEAVKRIRKALAKADVFIHDPANRERAREILLQQIPADSSDEMKDTYIEYALSVLSAAYSSDDLEKWVDLGLSAGILTQKMNISDIYAVGTPASEEDVRRMAAE